MKRSLVPLIFGAIACTNPQFVLPDGGEQFQVTVIAQPVVTLMAGGSATLQVIVDGVQGNIPPGEITVGPLPSGITSPAIPWHGEPTVTFTIAASPTTPISEFHANVTVTLNDTPSGATTTDIIISASDGALDPTFGAGGMTTLAIATNASASSFVAAGGGRWFVGASSDSAHGFVNRLASDGSIDSTFAPTSTFGIVEALDVDPGGDVLAVTAPNAALLFDITGTSTLVPYAGSTAQYGVWDGLGGFVVNGSLIHFDASHQTSSVDLGGATPTSLLSYQGAAYIGVLYSGASFLQKWSAASPGNYAIDETFGGPGGVIGPEPTWFSKLAVDSNDRILAASTGPSTTVMRYLADGTVDTSFGDGGIARIDWGDSSTSVTPIAILMLPSHKFVVVELLQAQTDGVLLARFTEDGTADPAFGAYGRTITLSNQMFYAVGAGYDASTQRVCVGENVQPASTSTVVMACYHVTP